MSKLKRTAKARPTAVAATVVAVLALAAALPVSSSASTSLSQLHASLQQAQSQAAGLSVSVSHLSGLIGSLGSQISFVEQREAAVRAQLAGDRASLARTTVALARERRHLAILIARLHRAESILAKQLVSNYESGSPDFISVLLTSDGFSQLLNKLNYLRNAEQEQKTEIAITRQARNQVHAATVRLAALQATYRQMTFAAAGRVRALAGMNALLQSRQAALQQARAAQQVALAAAQSRGQALQSQIAQVEAQQAAAERAAQAAPALPVPTGGGASGSWAIPAAVVACESGGQNLSPNGAGASGFYQIIPSTWKEFGGSGPAAYLASRQEQSLIAQKIWSSDPAAWDCARMLGIG